LETEGATIRKGLCAILERFTTIHWYWWEANLTERISA